MPPPLRPAELYNSRSWGPEMAIQVISVLILVLESDVFHLLSIPGNSG
jgi:hypothetical protein